MPKRLSFSFLPIPEELMRSNALSFGAKFLFGIIAKANKEDIKWSKKYLAERMNCSSREVQNRIKELEENNLIKVNRDQKGRVSIYNVNLELLTIIQGGERSFSTQGGEHSVLGGGEQPVPPHTYKEQSLKKENVANATGLQSFLDKLLTSPQRHIQVIGIWARETNLDLSNEEIYKSIIKRNLRPARLLAGYEDKDVVETIEVVKNTDYIKKFTLETITKYIDEVKSQNKTKGPKIVRFEEIIDNKGIKAMRPIYAKD